MATHKGEYLRRDPAYPALKDIVIALTGLGYWSDKDDMLSDLLAALVERWGKNASALLQRLQREAGHGPVTEAAIDAVTVGETSFFRYQAQFDALEREIIPEVMERNRATRSLSIWSAGCSNGAEAYSVAILLQRRFGAMLAGWRVDIVGSDISVGALAAASIGEYGAWSIRDLPPNLLHECFAPRGRQWWLKPPYRQGVRFVRHNLVTQPPPGDRFDVVLCRNVLMYFTPPIRRRVLLSLRSGMAEGGWLLVGHAETGTCVSELFSTEVRPDCTLYRRREEAP
ncbi:MAG TPA: protein-glutamate O-methyltransferase CheR [Magnetospirillum sp.]|nr:protein-glutamate O-methyltransferase CheR [Magnetospirillum sp.]